MKKFRVKDVEIHYENEDINYISKVIENNYGFFKNIKILSFLEDNTEDIYHIDDFNTFFNDFITYFFEEEKIKKLFDLPTLYLEILKRKNNIKSISIDDDILYSIIAYMYYDKKNFFNYLINRDNTEMLNFLKENYEEKIYKSLINNLKDELISNDLYSHTSLVCSTLNKEENNCNYELDSMNKEEIYMLFYEFLDYINAPKEWYTSFDELKDKIIFRKLIDINESGCFIDKFGNFKLIISTDGKSSTFPIFVHEFIHYINMDLPISIIEYPSIYFENVSSYFLEEKGYKNILNNTLNKRYNSNIKSFKDYINIYNDINEFNEKEDYGDLINMILTRKNHIIDGYIYIFDTFLANKENNTSNVINLINNKIKRI